MDIQKKWFTLVELIVVVTILAILGTIGFISYNGYLVWVRDSNRTTQIDLLSNGLELYRTKNPLPLPGWTTVRIEASGWLLWYQWYATQEIRDLIDYSKWWKDPKDNVDFTYYVSGDRKYYQLVAFLEDQANQAQSFFPTAYAADYTNRYPATAWKKLGVLLDWGNTPIQESPNWAVSSEFDMYQQTNSFQLLLSDKNIIKWTGPQLVEQNYKASCKRIKEIGGGTNGDTLYPVNPKWDNEQSVYCNMTMDGGWWTLVWRSVSSVTSSTFWFTSSGWKVTDDSIPYSLNVQNVWIKFNEIMFGNYVSGKDLGELVYKFNFNPDGVTASGSINNFTASTIAIPWASTVVWQPTSIKWLWKFCTGPGGTNGDLPTQFTHMWNSTRTTGFFVGLSANSGTHWLTSTGFLFPYVSDTSCLSWRLAVSAWWAGKQWLMFVR